jgi:hypothetical protein
MTPPFKAMSFERVVCKFVTAQGDPRLGPAHPDLSYDGEQGDQSTRIPTYAFFSGCILGSVCVGQEVRSMPNVHGIEFKANQSELVKDIVRELLKDGNCAVYAVPHIKPNGELRIALTPPIPGPRHQHGDFLRIRAGVNEATVLRPMNAEAGEPLAKLTKFSRPELLDMIRIWRKQEKDTSADRRKS